ncbi:fused MFS/spermidine synthase [Pseudoalteromonas sp. SMS1]|uniref:spermidine synthase n=1 Tax=Pseudoalteromonas sp. SMS1 TaxID=2908894 RepID=UPI001F42D23D|nr:fused MFS/spermidine synthase [Pseudoalteromonas sp. SMS1]MCF2857122.1 fused MFS/spermidine synthase [Pseudoalteromonas sp. SMS1]
MPKAIDQHEQLSQITQLNEQGKLYEVYQNNELRWLCIDGCVQSAMSLSHSDALMFPHMLFMTLPLHVMKTPTRALELGLGGGGTLRHLAEHYPTLNIEVVEYDKTVIALYEAHFNPQQHNHTIHCMDARQFVRDTTSAPFDLIFVDVFDSAEPVTFMFEPSFYQDIKKRVTKSSWIVLNTVLSTQVHLETLHKVLIDVFSGTTIYGFKAEQFANFVWLISTDNQPLDPIWRAQALFELHV